MKSKEPAIIDYINEYLESAEVEVSGETLVNTLRKSIASPEGRDSATVVLDPPSGLKMLQMARRVGQFKVSDIEGVYIDAGYIHGDHAFTRIQVMPPKGYKEETLWVAFKYLGVPFENDGYVLLWAAVVETNNESWNFGYKVLSEKATDPEYFKIKPSISLNDLDVFHVTLSILNDTIGYYAVL